MKTPILLASIAAALLLAAAPFSVTAAPITYTLSNASGTFGALGTIDFTGSFTFNPSNPTPTQLIAVDITATGPTPSLLTTSPELFTIPEPANVSSTTIGFGSTTSTDFLTIGFVSPLTNATALINIVEDNSPASLTTSVVTGEAVPTIPEPGSLALLGGAIGLFLLARREPDRRAHHTRPDQPARA